MKEWMEVCFLSSDSAGIRAAVEEEEEMFLKWPTHRERGGREPTMMKGC